MQSAIVALYQGIDCDHNIFLSIADLLNNTSTGSMYSLVFVLRI